VLLLRPTRNRQDSSLRLLVELLVVPSGRAPTDVEFLPRRSRSCDEVAIIYKSYCCYLPPFAAQVRSKISADVCWSLFLLLHINQGEVLLRSFSAPVSNFVQILLRRHKEFYQEVL
jgi:hypothetical protein